ncbi:MAG: hypothetical protein AAGA70_05555 [Pseudomonadota bacterium]
MSTISITPDPARPLGGFARLAVPANALADEAVSVVVFDVFSERFLGVDGFQGERVAFGPYSVTRSGGEASVIVGPEIVNFLEDVATVRIEMGSVQDTVAWPEDVVPAIGAARIGGIYTGGPMQAGGEDDGLVGLMPEDSTDDEEPPEQDDETIPASFDFPKPDPVPAPAPPNRAPLLFSVLLMLLLAAGAAYWYFVMNPEAEIAEDDPPVVADEPLEEVVDLPEPNEPNPCDEILLDELVADSFASASATLAQCAGEIDPELAFRVLEQAAFSGQADALVILAKAYDSETVDAVFETDIGVVLSDSDALAVEYYRRALSAGAPDVAPLLDAVCARLEGATSQIDTAAREENCP